MCALGSFPSTHHEQSSFPFILYPFAFILYKSILYPFAFILYKSILYPFAFILYFPFILYPFAFILYKSRSRATNTALHISLVRSGAISLKCQANFIVGSYRRRVDLSTITCHEHGSSPAHDRAGFSFSALTIHPCLNPLAARRF
jgi:hypothetical protein